MARICLHCVLAGSWSWSIFRATRTVVISSCCFYQSIEEQYASFSKNFEKGNDINSDCLQIIIKPFGRGVKLIVCTLLVQGAAVGGGEVISIEEDSGLNI